MNCQSIFRPHRFTQDNVAFTSQKISEKVSPGHKMVTVMFEIASAFDKVSHKGLLFKLAKKHSPEYLIDLIKDFLTDQHKN